jgi:hypothetical protein
LAGDPAERGDVRGDGELEEMAAEDGFEDRETRDGSRAMETIREFEGILGCEKGVDEFGDALRELLDAMVMDHLNQWNEFLVIQSDSI